LLGRDIDRLAAAFDTDVRGLDRAAGLLDDEVRRARMLPFAEACAGLERIVRDVAQAAGKQVELSISGGEVELDRAILEGLKDPLAHLVRNAVDHGIEAPEVRRAVGKPEVGRVAISAELRGTQIEIVVEDDGGGLDLDALRRQARRLGLAEPKGARELARLSFAPGVSTAERVTTISGRGLGLDVARARVEAVRGTLDVASEPGRGTRFTLLMPLTLTTLRALFVNAGGQSFAVAVSAIRSLLRVNSQAVLTLNNFPIPVVSLAQTLGLKGDVERPHKGRRPAILASDGERQVVLAVDELLGEQEIVVKGLGARIRQTRFFSGSTLLTSGRIALVLNMPRVARSALDLDVNPRPEPPTQPTRPRILVADDSATTRALQRGILEVAGYEVLSADDGDEAWRRLQDEGADLVISDVEMPRMNGFELTQTIRSSARFASLPVILITSRGDPSGRAIGVAMGANAYITKRDFDQDELLGTIQRLL
jgi:two-component system chemotaxis sensor kinase CheA